LCTSIGVISRQLSGCMLLLLLGSMAWRGFLFSWCCLFEQSLYFYMSVHPINQISLDRYQKKVPVSKTARKAIYGEEREVGSWREPYQTSILWLSPLTLFASYRDARTNHLHVKTGGLY
jgi:hypothetical protein